MGAIHVKDIEQARKRIAGHVLHAPLINAGSLSQELGTETLLKLEFLQETGSFKLRGAMNAVLSLDEDTRARGVVTASSGNHGPALACAAKRTGGISTICLSEMVPQNKVDNVRASGGIARIEGGDYDDALEICMDLVRKEGLHLVHPFDDPAVVAGAGTIGLELLDDAPDLDCILVPLSGGGLLAGVATAVKARASGIRVIGISMERGASMIASLNAGKPVSVKELSTVADALGGNIGVSNQWTFETVRDLTDDCVTVSEDQIKSAMRLLFETQGLMVEGAGAVGIAALMCGKVEPDGRVACVLSGRNISTDAFLNIVKPCTGSGGNGNVQA